MPTALVLQHEDACPADRLTGWLAESGVTVELCRPYAGDPVPERLDAGGLIVLGGHMGAADDSVAPWLPATRALLARNVAEAVPTLGICLGAQLLALACGGRVEVGAAGIEAGVVDVRWRPEAGTDPLLGGAPVTAGPSMHLDEVVDLPPGAVWLADSARYRHQAFRVGDRAWGVQFHPEVSLPTFTGWARQHDPDWPGWGIDGDAVVAELAGRDAEVERAGRRLAVRFGALLRETAEAPATRR